MKSLFDYDGYLNRLLTKVMYIVAVNLLFLICSLPVFTIGASSAAAYAVLLRYIQGDEPDIIRTFLKEFRSSFKKATMIWMGMLIVIILWVYIYPAVSYYQNSVGGYLQFAIRAAIGNLPVTAAVVLLQTIPLFGILFLAQFLPMAVPVLICCGFSLPAYLSGHLLLRILKRYGKEQE